jgi:polysaccharide export outer membrane protein
MKYATVVSHVRVLALAALCTLAPQPAGAQPEEEDIKAGRAAPAIDGSYLIGAGDKLRIEVYKDLQLSQSLQVRPDGKITLPLIGDLDAKGQTPIALRDSIATKLKEYMTNPVVTVIVVEASPATAYVVGEVNRPGAVTMPTGPMTVLQALAMAGGLKDFADSKNIRILRSSTIFGIQTIGFDYKDAIRGGAAVYLRPGDTVVVPD